MDDERYARTRAHGLLAARKSRRAAAQDLRQKGLDAQQILSLIHISIWASAVASASFFAPGSVFWVAGATLLF